MPELPEVETIKRGLQNLQGKIVADFSRSSKKLRIDNSLNFKALIGNKVSSIQRRARYLKIGFDNDLTLLIHLGMSGRLTIQSQVQNKKHDHFILHFHDGVHLAFNDPRRFGFVDLIKNKDLPKHKMLSNLGPEPFDDQFNSDYLYKIISNKTTNIKTTMMDNKIVVGVGNIYINESLFASKISPTRSCKSLSKKDVDKLVSSIKQILTNAIEHGGSSISDYVNSDGELGNFQNNFKIYGQKKCLLCNNSVSRLVQSGRSSFMCNKCQK